MCYGDIDYGRDGYYRQWAEEQERKAEERLLERTCRVCGCTDDHACPGGCYWVEDDLCSKCVGKDEELES